MLFGTLSLISPLANLLVAPAIPFGMLFSFLSVIGGNFFGGVFGFLAWSLLHAALFVIDLLARWKWASITLSIGSTMFWVLSAGLLIGGMWIQRREWRRQ